MKYSILGKVGPFKYASLQVVLPQGMVEDLSPVWELMRESGDLYEAEAEGGVEDDLHVTVLYGMQDSDLETVREVCGGHEGFPIQFGNLVVFEDDDRDYDVVVVEIISGAIHQLHDDLVEATDPHQSYPDYVPHMTLGYFNKGTGNNHLGYYLMLDPVHVTDVEFSPVEGEKETIQLKGVS